MSAEVSPAVKRNLINDMVFLSATLLAIGVIVYDSINQVRASDPSRWAILVSVDLILIVYFIYGLAGGHSEAVDRKEWWTKHIFVVMGLFPLLGTAIPGLTWAGVLRFSLLVPATQGIFRLLGSDEGAEITVRKRILHLAIIVVLLTVAGGMLALMFELEHREKCIADPRCNEGAQLTEMDEAMWWAIETVTTVGYGEFYPMSLGARVVASILLFVGIGVLGVLAATFAERFLEVQIRRQSEREHFLSRMHLLTDLHDRGQLTDAQFVNEKQRLVESHEEDEDLLRAMDSPRHRRVVDKTEHIEGKSARVEEAKRFFEEVADSSNEPEE